MRTHWSFSLLLLGAWLSAAPASASRAAAPFCLILESTDAAETWRTVDALARLGCSDLIAHGEGVVEGISDEAPERLAKLAGVVRVLDRPADAATLQSLSEPVRARLELWSILSSRDADRAKAPQQPAADAATISDDACVLLPPSMPEPSAAKAGRDIPRLPKYNKAWGAEDYQTSEFFLGRIAVGIVTPQVRSGARWTRDELLAVADAARGAMLYWKGRAAKWSDHPVYLAFEYLDSLETTSSPLTASNDMRWVSPLMASARARLGITEPPPALAKIPDQTFADVYQVVNFLRIKWHADWGFLFVVGWGTRFTEQPGLGAYAMLGGPFLVSPHAPVGNWTLEGLLIHESGHTFFALDEYCCGGTSSPCSAVSGYLAVANRNSRNRGFGGCASTTTSCTMATPGRSSCAFTEGMMGIQDSNGDGVRDILSTQPIVDLLSRDGVAMFDSLGRRALSDTITSLTPLFTGIVRDSPLPNKIAISGIGAGERAFSTDDPAAEPAAAGNRAAITMNSLASAEFRIDAGEWRWIRPDSSGYDSAVEDFRVYPSGLSGGTHTIEFRGTNSVGKSTEARATTKHKLVVLAVALDQLAVANEMSGGFNITWSVRGEAWGSTAKLYRATSSRPEELVTTVPLRSNGTFAYVDKQVLPGRRYTYRVETEAFGKTYALSAEATASAPIRDDGARLSSATPNPFRSQTILSYAVPEGLLGPRPPKDDGNKPGPPPEFPTSPHGDMGVAGESATGTELVRLPVAVSVTIHDVSGRVVRHLVGDYVAGSRIYTTFWNGADDNGDLLPAGVYFSRLQAGQFVDTNKLVLMK
ncbi:MAG: hypothetical protein ACKVU1_08170 [bacterium]